MLGARSMPAFLIPLQFGPEAETAMEVPWCANELLLWTDWDACGLLIMSSRAIFRWRYWLDWIETLLHIYNIRTCRFFWLNMWKLQVKQSL